MTYPGLFAITVGAAMIAVWMASYLSKNIPELESEPIRIRFHILAEVVTAIALLAAGVGLMAAQPWARPLYPVALGMLFYTAILSPGYFAEKGDWKWLAFFIALICGGLIALAMMV